MTVFEMMRLDERKSAGTTTELRELLKYATGTVTYEKDLADYEWEVATEGVCRRFLCLGRRPRSLVRHPSDVCRRLPLLGRRFLVSVDDFRASVSLFMGGRDE